MTVPYVIVAAVLGPEFPSLLGGLIGLALVMFTSSRGLPDAEADLGPSAARALGGRWTGSLEADTARSRQAA
jgi:lactate permease